jgi:hypothetical protein
MLTVGEHRQCWLIIGNRVSSSFFDLNDRESTVTSSKVLSTPVINRLVSLESKGIRTYRFRPAPMSAPAPLAFDGSEAIEASP